MRILIADDDPTSREIARQLIAHAGHHVDAVCDGAAALDAIRRAAYAIAILDLQMPRLDGAEVARAVRAALPDGRPRLVAFTAGSSAEADRGLLALGFDACLPKPIRRAALDAILDGAAPPPPPLAAPPPPAPAAPSGAVALLSAPAAPLEALRGAAASLKAEALAAEQLALAGLCARLEAAAAAHDRPAAAELAAIIAALLA